MRGMISTSAAGSSSDNPVSLTPTVSVTLDSKGRVRASKEQRRLILAEYEHSGLSAARFAKLAGLKYSTFAGWLQRYRRAKPKGPAKPVRLLEAVVTPPEPSILLVLHLPGGARVEISDEQQAELAAALVRSLARPC